ncbi:helix-turn-helix domain-containing protein [Streptomyces sp. NBC_01358]|uniref:helix-turn-helix domain-containing protein n=1 Tax=Streptomyces sp. NBC_01358 TaxID=2903837 RepID=UPI002E36CE94|nr:helix-turn-helix domain-containing protein [Streptomyces sp. NBC_01358]
MTDDVSKVVQRVFDALSELEGIEDPTERAAAISQVLADHSARAPRLRELRREAVLALRAEKVSYRKIAARLGVSLGTVQDIERGHGGAWGTKARKKAVTEGSVDDESPAQ